MVRLDEICKKLPSGKLSNRSKQPDWVPRLDSTGNTGGVDMFGAEIFQHPIFWVEPVNTLKIDEH